MPANGTEFTRRADFAKALIEQDYLQNRKTADTTRAEGAVGRSDLLCGLELVFLILSWVVGQKSDYAVNISEVLNEVVKIATNLIPSELTTCGMCNIIPGESELSESKRHYALECIFKFSLIQRLTVLAHKLAR